MLDLTSTGEITVSKLWRHPSFFLCFVGIPGRDATGQHTVFTTFRLGLNSLIYEFILEIISSLHISYYTVITVSRDFFFSHAWLANQHFSRKCCTTIPVFLMEFISLSKNMQYVLCCFVLCCSTSSSCCCRAGMSFGYGHWLWVWCGVCVGGLRYAC